ncbi:MULTISPECIES: FMN-dependent NADH-azoreductase [Gluconobacter]|uniref:FMN dependent NADH:quinone oxidoreductase n=1 Tax=Gluconobacter cadivus TaxID=2728101 RepID=A0ABR9YRI4_9PROT|nr:MULTISPECIES: NAD(P)H-dependent oxidoreductase [Gluconobacter]MBF0887144.1 FMN-dependent NADH-azoreductase [Gluconobacter cadivus]MBS1059213.1 NAD(P)H-dependent oxidoreductase [Gluconobacter sp. Dm-44]
MKLLHIDSSILGDSSASRQVSAAAVAQFRKKDPSVEVISLDLASDPLPHLDVEALSWLGKELTPDVSARPELVASGKALSDFKAADVVVIGVPMYNLSIPSQLKSWVDRIMVAGQTFRYGPSGIEGLAKGKTVVLAVARGGLYGEGSPAASFEHQLSYLKSVFTMIGITDITVIEAEGLATNGGADRARILSDAEQKASAL